MVLTNPEEVDAEFVGEHGLVDDIAKDLRERQRLPVGITGSVAKGVEAKFEWR
jgi:hypothetical protein